MKKITKLMLATVLAIGVLVCVPQAKLVHLSSASEGDYTAKSVLLMDSTSGNVLYEKDKDKQLPIASMVKLMTILLTLENIDAGSLAFDQKIVASKNASGMGGSQVFIDANAEYTVGDLLKSAIVASANDASVALAEAIAGSEREFVERMNKRALELGMKNTSYGNATGLPAVNAYSSAYDVALLMREVLKHPLYYTFSGIWLDELTHPSGRKTELANTNKLIRYYKGCDAGKTGSTNEAGFCVSASAKKNDLRMIAVVMGAKTGPVRFSEAASLLDYGFANFENKKILSAGVDLGVEAKIAKAQISSIKPIVAADCFSLCKKMEDSEVGIKYEVNNNLSAPLKKGDKVGTAYILKNGVVEKEVDLICPIDIEKATLTDSFLKIIRNFRI